MDSEKRDIVGLIAKVIAEASDSDSNCEVLMAGRQYPSIQEFASAIPNHLLLGSLLEHLCFVYERDPTRSRMLFKAIGQRLAAMNLLSPLAVSDEFSTVRLQHSLAFTELLQAASSSLFPQDHRYLSAEGQNAVLRVKDGLFQAQTSRYLSEFEEISALGKGSYGKVFKVKNKLDGQYYAVKKILMKNVTRDDCIKVLREVKVLSSLQNPNIVGYHTAWMEHVQLAGKNPQPVLSNAIPALGTSQTEGCLGEGTGSTSGSSIVFESSDRSKDMTDRSACAPEGISLTSTMSHEEESQAVCPKNVRNPQNFVPCVFLGKPSSTPNTCPVLSWDTSAGSENEPIQNRLELKNVPTLSHVDAACRQRAEKRPNEVQFHLMLYIQMQLCERSLKDWIQERNCRPKEELTMPTGPCQSFDSKQESNILKKILEGVEYIHSRGIMHRDLKPRNIFLHGNDHHVKIGDFGLACEDTVVNEKEQLHLSSHTGNMESAHTTGVGTFVYASPEQLEGSHYDLKSDMYSVGVVAVELFQPFGTEMERVHTLGDLRHGEVPNTLCEDWPVLTKYVRLLTSPDPSLRPSASHLLQSDLFSTKDMVIHSLQKRIDKQEEEIDQLRRQISQLQSSQDTAHDPDKT
ncbi:eukaryotic translation initiation factor 2-alpha kinase 1 isoform X2 [Brachyhypopomus gauderio]|uniref:eukaryotic translation initiation factor 2-alpha kinase 1 isoform X2 n=1 Tax=Brachyhypopomus gauderio TaxID=698409 RepID=UPI004042930B